MKQLLKIVVGGKMERGQYELTFNDDGENYWYLRFNDNNVKWTVQFDSASHYGDSGAMLFKETVPALSIQGLPDDIDNIIEELSQID